MRKNTKKNEINNNKNQELIKNTLIIFVGRFCTQFISFLLIPIYTYNLSTADYGYVDVVQTYISLIIPILLLRLDSSIFRFLIDARKDKSEQKIIISNSAFFILIQNLLFIIIFFILNCIFHFKYAFAILLNGILMSISSILLQMVRGIGKNIDYSIASIIAGISTIILNIIFIIGLGLDGSSILYATAIANLLCSLYLIFRNKTYKLINIKNVKKKKFKDMLKYSLPMIPDGLSWWIVNVSDRTIITFILGTAANGIYAISSKFSNILSSLYQIFNMSWQESASLHINDNDNSEFFTGVLDNIYRIFFTICVLLLVMMPFIFKIFIGEEYQSAILYIPPLLLGNLYNATANVLGGVYIAIKKTKYGARTTVMAAIINILINVILINKIGLFAASISTLISYIILTIYRYIDVQKYVKIKADSKLIVITTLYFIVCLIIYYYNNILFNVLSLLICILVSYILNKNNIKKINHRLLEKIKERRGSI